MRDVGYWRHLRITIGRSFRFLVSIPNSIDHNSLSLCVREIVLRCISHRSFLIVNNMGLRARLLSEVLICLRLTTWLQLYGTDHPTRIAAGTRITLENTHVASRLLNFFFSVIYTTRGKRKTSESEPGSTAKIISFG